MKTMWQSHGKMTTCLLILLVYLILYSNTTSAQSLAKASICDYQETRQNVPINPKTNKPYMPAERNQEPFAEASIKEEQIKECLRANMNVPEDKYIPIRNHHIVFEEYLKAWKALAEEKKDYAIPLSIEGGVLHANTPYDKETRVGGIGLWEFGDPKITNTSQLSEEERKTFGITKKDAPIVPISSNIRWENVFIDTTVTSTGKDNNFTIFSNEVSFIFTTFNNIASFNSAIFKNYAYFNYTTFNN